MENLEITKVVDTNELQIAGDTARAQHEIQSAIIVAKRFPRNEEAAYGKLIKACKRTSFAEAANYAFPRGGATVTGPSVNLAREAARVWGNVRYGIDITRDSEQSRGIKAWAWDVETNLRVEQEDEFEKRVQRKNKQTGKTEWVTPDERDLRELTNKRGAIALRNCLLQVIPKDFIEDALDEAKKTLRSEAEQDPDGAIKKLVVGFGDLRITPEMLAVYLGHPVTQCSPAEIANLRSVWTSIKDGNSTWSDYVASEEVKEKSAAKTDQLKEKYAKKDKAEVLPPEGQPLEFK